MYVHFFLTQCYYCAFSSLQYSVNTTIICTGKPKTVCDLLYGNIHFTVVVRNPNSFQREGGYREMKQVGSDTRRSSFFALNRYADLFPGEAPCITEDNRSHVSKNHSLKNITELIEKKYVFWSTVCLKVFSVGLTHENPGLHSTWISKAEIGAQNPHDCPTANARNTEAWSCQHG